MATQTAHPGTLANLSFGTVAWVNSSNAAASDNAYATATMSTAGYPFSDYLKATNFGFSIPGNSTIDGVEFKVERKCDLGKTLSEMRVIVGDDVDYLYGAGGGWTASDAIETRGSSSTNDAGLTAGQINDSGFGMAVAAAYQNLSGAETEIAYIDDFTITVYYTEPSAAGDAVSLDGTVGCQPYMEGVADYAPLFEGICGIIEKSAGS